MTTSEATSAHSRSDETAPGATRRGIVVALSRPTTIFFVASLALGLVLRIWLTYSTAFTLDSDTSIVYLMSLRVAKGEFSSIFWGQQYGGTTLQIVAGLVMLVTGPSWRVLAIVGALFFLAATIVLRQIAVRTLGVVWGDLAGILMWFPLTVATMRTVTDPGFYGPSLLYGLLVLYLALSPTRASRTIWSWAALGALAGLALWTSPASVALAAPGVLLALWSDRRWSRWLIGGVAALVTASPWLIKTLQDHGKTVAFRGFHTQSFASLFTSLLPAAVPFGSDERVAFVVTLLSVAAVGGPVWFGLRRRDTPSLLIGTGTILLITSLVLGAGVRLAPDSVRYVALLLPEFAFAVALLLSRWRRTWLMPVVAVAAIAATILSLGFHGAFQRAASGAVRSEPRARRVVPRGEQGRARVRLVLARVLPDGHDQREGHRRTDRLPAVRHVRDRGRGRASHGCDRLHRPGDRQDAAVDTRASDRHEAFLRGLHGVPLRGQLRHLLVACRPVLELAVLPSPTGAELIGPQVQSPPGAKTSLTSSSNQPTSRARSRTV